MPGGVVWENGNAGIPLLAAVSASTWLFLKRFSSAIFCVWVPPFLPPLFTVLALDELF
jgi:hypothetical protein